MKQIVILFTILLLTVSTALKSTAQVVINEILASNISTNLELQDKNFFDWIELYNPSDKTVSIGGWFLSDNKKKKTKWEIPYYFSIAPNGYKLFWNNKKDFSNHTNFKLNDAGETVYLYNKDSILIDSISYPKQVQDISYGRKSGSRNELVYFHESTPMKENPRYGNKELDFNGIPIFSNQAGFYDKSFTLKLSTSKENEKIYYTVDGSKPTQESVQYTNPIEINSNTTIRARAFAENKLPGKVITQTYIINELYSLPVISLVTDPRYLWDKDIGIYVKGSKYKDDVWETANYFQSWERPVNVEYFDIDGNQGFNITAGVKIHGRSTRNYAQKTLAIFAREKYGNSTVPYKLFDERSPETIKTFLLRNDGNDWGITWLLDGFIHSIVLEKIDIDAQLYQPSIVLLNGDFWGLHNIREKINEHYIKHKLDDESVKFDIIEADVYAGKMQATQGNIKEYNKMIEFIENNELSKKENYDTIKQWIDIDEFINYLITQIYITNRDWPGSNVKFWKVRGDTGKWRWILYDTDFSCEENNEYYDFDMFEYLLKDNSMTSNPEWSNFVIRELFENEDFKNEFIQRMAIYLNTVFDPERVLYVLDSLKNNIEPEINKNIEKWGGIKQSAVPYRLTSPSQEEWEFNIELIRSFFKNRPSIVRKRIIKNFEVKDTVNLKLGINEKNAGRISLMGHNIEDAKFNGYVFSDVPIRIEAIPYEGYKFIKWKGIEIKQNDVFIINRSKKITAIFEKIE